MTQYLLSVWHDHFDADVAAIEPADMERMFAQVDAFNTELQDTGAWVFAGGLNSPSSATVVRASAGDVSMTDGPYAESKEQIGGFWVIEAPDLDAALEWARKGSVACEGAVEVRQDGLASGDGEPLSTVPVMTPDHRLGEGTRTRSVDSPATCSIGRCARIAQLVEQRIRNA